MRRGIHLPLFGGLGLNAHHHDCSITAFDTQSLPGHASEAPGTFELLWADGVE
jgi:hypothetical protein